MAGNTTGIIETSKEVGKNMVTVTLKCSCGHPKGQSGTVGKGTRQTWGCYKCKQNVTVIIPK